MVVCIDMNFIACIEKDDKRMATYIYCWIGEKGRDNFEALLLREDAIWTNSETLMIMKTSTD